MKSRRRVNSAVRRAIRILKASGNRPDVASAGAVMALSGIEGDTDQLAQQFLEALWSVESDASAAELESKLSTVIRLTEEMIHIGKRAPVEGYDRAMRRRRAILKRIADALVWYMFGLHRRFLRIYAMGQSPGFMAGKDGYLGERLVVAKAQEFIPEPYRSQGRCVFAIQNDITNCLRFGDVTCLMDDGSIVPFEIKVGRPRRGRRNRRQAERHDAITDYLKQDSTSSPLVFELPLKHVVSDDTEDSHGWNLVEAVAESVTIGRQCCWAVGDDCTLVLGVDSIREDVLRPSIERALSELGWNIQELRFGSLDRHIASQENEVLSSLMPIMNWPISHKVITEIVLERVWIFVFVNVRKVRDMAAQEGIRVQPVLDTEPTRLALSTAQPDGTVVVAAGLWNRLIYELLTIPSFIAQLRLVEESGCASQAPAL
jgi:hypothetical protein